MSEIKFRAWDIANNDMFMVDSMAFRENGDVFRVWKRGTEGEGGLLIHSTSGRLMQYTGVKDVNGKDIYNGDIIKNYQGDIQTVRRGVGRWRAVLEKRATSFWPAQYLDCTYMEWDVIGNIYENPELVESEHKS